MHLLGKIIGFVLFIAVILDSIRKEDGSGREREKFPTLLLTIFSFSLPPPESIFFTHLRLLLSKKSNMVAKTLDRNIQLSLAKKRSAVQAKALFKMIILSISCYIYSITLKMQHCKSQLYFVAFVEFR